MPHREEWADHIEALDAFWRDEPDFSRMDIETRELWHAFAASAEQHETAVLIAQQRGHTIRKVVHA